MVLSRILFVTANRLGDAVLSTGALARLLAEDESRRAWVACGPVPAPLFAAMPGVERVIPLVKRPWAGHWRELLGQCLFQRFEMVADLRRSPLTRLIPAGRHVTGRHDEGDHRIEELQRTFGFATPPAPELAVNDAARVAAAEALPDGPPVLGLGPTANWAGKTWRPERFVELARRLTAADGPLPGARIAVFGAPDEAAAARPVVADLGAVDLVGHLELPAVAAALGRCALYVGNDSGLMHMAAAMATPTLGLFGPSREERYRPWGDQAAAVRTRRSYDDIISRPGYDHRTAGNDLMDTLSVDRAVRAAADLWQRVQEKGPCITT